MPIDPPATPEERAWMASLECSILSAIRHLSGGANCPVEPGAVRAAVGGDRGAGSVRAGDFNAAVRRLQRDGRVGVDEAGMFFLLR